MLFRSIKRFLDLDIRWKFKVLGRQLKLKIYPEKFHLKGWRSIYTKIIFYFIFKEKTAELYKKNYNLIFREINQETTKNLLIAMPRSGSNFLRNLITSYITLEKKIGNGVPKYDGITDTWKNLASTICSGDLYNSIIIDPENFKMEKIIEKNELQKKRIFFSRHPINSSDLIDVKCSKVMLLIRNPKEQIKSWIMTKSYAYNYTDKMLENELNIQIDKNLKFLKYWNKKFINLKFKGLIVDFDDLSKKTFDEFKKILTFYKYEIDEKIILNSIEINSKENYLKYMGQKEKSIRFLNNEIKKNFLRKIDDLFHNERLILDAEKHYKNILSLKKN